MAAGWGAAAGRSGAGGRGPPELELVIGNRGRARRPAATARAWRCLFSRAPRRPGRPDGLGRMTRARAGQQFRRAGPSFSLWSARTAVLGADKVVAALQTAQKASKTFFDRGGEQRVGRSPRGGRADQLDDLGRTPSGWSPSYQDLPAMKEPPRRSGTRMCSVPM